MWQNKSADLYTKCKSYSIAYINRKDFKQAKYSAQKEVPMTPAKTVTPATIGSEVMIEPILNVADVPAALTSIQVNTPKMKWGRLQKFSLFTPVSAPKSNPEPELKFPLSTSVFGLKGNQEPELFATSSLPISVICSDVQPLSGDNTITDADFVSQRLSILKKKIYNNKSDKLFECS